jgi:hypothetical protein
MNIMGIEVLCVGVSALLEAARKVNFRDILSQIAAGFACGRYKYFFLLENQIYLHIKVFLYMLIAQVLRL